MPASTERMMQARRLSCMHEGEPARFATGSATPLEKVQQ
jgi:hypothetical protein